MTLTLTPSDPVIATSFYNRAKGQYDQIKAYAGDLIDVAKVYGGVVFITPDGREGVAQSRFTKYTLARFADSGLVEPIAVGTMVTVVRRDAGWGLPPTGTVVEVLKGERQGELGIVVHPGVNSTHVIFPSDTPAVSNTRFGPKYIKYPARNLKIVKGEITRV